MIRFRHLSADYEFVGIALNVSAKLRNVSTGISPYNLALGCGGS